VPLHLPPATFVSIPLTEQDVVGLFHQLSALGVFPGIKIYATSQTLEFKNNLDGLIADIDGEGATKNFNHINICVCWSTIDSNFKGYNLVEITEVNLDERQYPGVTHILQRDGDSHVIQIVMLKRIIDIIQAGPMHLGSQ